MTVRLIKGMYIWPNLPLRLMIFQAIGTTRNEPVVVYPDGREYGAESIQPGQEALIPRDWIVDIYEVRKLGRLPDGTAHRLYVLKEKPELVFIAPESFDTMVPTPEELQQS
jgi:hypothetical protein